MRPALKITGARHRPDDIAECVARLRKKIANISLDLIFGVPGQTLESWHDHASQDVRTAADAHLHLWV